MKISFIIVSWNTCEKTCVCIESIRKYMPEHEIIVVDNNSADDSCEQIKQQFPEVRLIENDDNRGFGTANNQGAAIAEGNVFCFINSDTEVLDDGLEGLAQGLISDVGVGVVGPKIIFGDGRFQSSYARFHRPLAVLFGFGFELFCPVKSPFHYWKSYWGRRFKTRRRVDWVSGCCLIIEKSVFDDAGGWDERYFAYCEDPALCREVLMTGRATVYDPSVTVIHHHGSSFKQVDWVARVKNTLRSYCIFLFDSAENGESRLFKKRVAICWRLTLLFSAPFVWSRRVKVKRDILKQLVVCSGE